MPTQPLRAVTKGNHDAPTAGKRAGTAVAAVAAAALACAASPSIAATDVVGTWVDDTGRGAIRIETCGRQLCGRIVWLKQPLKANGQPYTDALNPEPGNRRRPICGLQVIGGLENQGDGSWDAGWIYDPKQGQAFDVAVSLAGTDELEVVGYKGIKLFSKTLIWRRAPVDLPTCKPMTATQTSTTQ